MTRCSGRNRRCSPNRASAASADRRRATNLVVAVIAVITAGDALPKVTSDSLSQGFSDQSPQLAAPDVAELQRRGNSVPSAQVIAEVRFSVPLGRSFGMRTAQAHLATAVRSDQRRDRSIGVSPLHGDPGGLASRHHVAAVLEVHRAPCAAPDHRDDGRVGGDYRCPCRRVVLIDPAPELARLRQEATHADHQVTRAFVNEMLDRELVASPQVPAEATSASRWFPAWHRRSVQRRSWPGPA
jgi:hypothetical protein